MLPIAHAPIVTFADLHAGQKVRDSSTTLAFHSSEFIMPLDSR